MSQFAPGPWRRGIGKDCNTVFDNQGRIVAANVGFDDGSLIAAALDMLEVCRGVASEFDDAKYPYSVEGRLRDKARAAIKKARAD